MRAGWCVALLYLLCVLAPAAALALPGQSAPCLTGASHMIHAAQVVSQMGEHGHGEAHAHASAHDASSAHVHHHAFLDGDAGDEGAPAKGHGQGLCCGVMCVSALPAAFADIGTPQLPTARRIVEHSRDVSNSAPARLDRPPRA